MHTLSWSDSEEQARAAQKRSFDRLRAATKFIAYALLEEGSAVRSA